MAGIRTTGVQVLGLEAVANEFRKVNGVVRMSAGQEVKLTTRAMLNAFSGSTKKAPPKRELKEFSRKTKAWHVNWKIGAVENEIQKIYAVKFWKNGHIKMRFLRYGTTKQEAQRSPLRNIGYQGLAKKSWWFNGNKTGTKVQGLATPEKARRAAQEAAEGTKANYKGDNPYSFTSNSVQYMTRAFYTQGDHTVASISHRASRWLEEWLKRDIQKKVKA